jgi:ABC-type nitrate/sulfonate/bicarbonate transport system substrate-binding protein
MPADPKRSRWRGRSVAAAMLVVFAVALPLGWGRLARTPPPSPSPPSTLRIGIPGGVAAASVVVAERRDLFAAHHLVVTTRVYPDGRAALAGLLAGEVDAAIAGDLPIARLSLDHPGLAVLAELGRSKEDRWLVAAKGAGIATSADLRGKRVGTQRHSGSHYVLTRVLESRGLAESDIVMVDLPVDGMAKALERGDVDAFTTEHPFPGPASLHYGMDVVELHDPAAYVLTYDLVEMKELGERIEAATDLMRALADADAVLHAEPDATIDLVALGLGLPREKVAIGASSFVPELRLDAALARTMDGEVRWFLGQTPERKRNEPRAPKADLIDGRPLLGARADLVHLE